MLFCELSLCQLVCEFCIMRLWGFFLLVLPSSFSWNSGNAQIVTSTDNWTPELNFLQCRFGLCPSLFVFYGRQQPTPVYLSSLIITNVHLRYHWNVNGDLTFTNKNPLFFGFEANQYLRFWILSYSICNLFIYVIYVSF